MPLQSSLDDKILKSNYQPVLPVMGNNFTKWSDRKTKFPNCPVSNEDNLLAKTKPKYKISRARERKGKKNRVNIFLLHERFTFGSGEKEQPRLKLPMRYPSPVRTFTWFWEVNLLSILWEDFPKFLKIIFRKI